MKKTLIFALALLSVILVACPSDTEVVEEEQLVTEEPAAAPSTETPATTETPTATAPTTTTTLSCTDSDRGLNSYSAGYVEDADKIKNNDRCANNILIEWYCTPAGQAKSKELTCPTKCNTAGTACEKPAEVIEAEQQATNQSQSSSSGSSQTTSAKNCTDTDNGLTYGTQGTCKDNKQYPSPFADLCTGARDMIEMSCNTAKDECEQTTYTCPGSCVGGKCV